MNNVVKKYFSNIGIVNQVTVKVLELQTLFKAILLNFSSLAPPEFTSATALTRKCVRMPHYEANGEYLQIILSGIWRRLSSQRVGALLELYIDPKKSLTHSAEMLSQYLHSVALKNSKTTTKYFKGKYFQDIWHFLHVQCIFYDGERGKSFLFSLRVWFSCFTLID